MSITRIKTNQITDLAVTNAKIANTTIEGGKLAANLTYGSNLTVSGNLTVNGTTTTISTTNTVVEDPVIVLAAEQTGVASVDAGILVERGDDTNVTFVWSEANDKWYLTETTDTGSDSSIDVTGTKSGLVMGGLTASTGDFSGAVGVDGNFDVGTTKFTVAVASGNVATTGTLDVAGLASLDGGIDVDGAFTVADTTGNVVTTGTLTAGNTSVGTLDASGLASLDGGIDVDGAFTVADTSGNVATTGTLSAGETTLSSATVSDLTSGRVVLAGTSGAIEDSGNLTFNGSTLAVTGATTISSTLTAGNTSVGTLDASGLASLDGGIDVDGAFTVADTSGNVATTGTLDAGGLASLDGGIDVDGAFTVADTSGNVATTGTLNVTGTSTLGVINASGLASLDAGIDVDGAFTVADTSGNVATTGTLNVTGTSTLGVINASGLASLDGGIDVDGAFTVADTSGNINTTGTLTVGGATTLNGAVTLGDASGDAITVTGTATFGASADFDGGFTVAASQTISMGANAITSVADPSNAQDAATKAYVDSQVSAGTAFDIAGDTGTDTVTVGTDTLTFSGTANEITTAVSNNKVTIGLPDDVTITGNLTVMGQTTTVESTVTSVADPIMTFGQNTSDDNKDRGIEFKYNDGTAKVGFFGFDDSAGTFTALTSATNTNEVFSGTVAPFVMGGLTASTGDFSGAVGVDGNFDVNTNKFTVAAASGNTVVAGTLDVAGLASLDGGIDVDGAFTVADTSGNVVTTGTLTAGNTSVGTLDASGLASLDGGIDVDGAFTVADTSGNVATTGTLDAGGLASLDGGIDVDGAFTVADTSGNVATSGTLSVTGTSTLGVINASGLASLDAGIDVDGAFTVADTTGNVVTTGTLTAGNTSVATLDASGLASLDGGIDVDGAFTVADTSGNIATTGTLSVTGTSSFDSTVTITGSDTAGQQYFIIENQTGTDKFVVDSANGNTTIAGTLGVTGETTLASARVSDLTNNRVVIVGASSDLEDSANLTFDGSTLAVTGAATISTTLGVTGEATFGTHVNMGDSDILKIGAGADLQLQHDGTNSSITNSTGILAIDGTATSSIRVNEAGANVDFIVEGDTNTALLVVDASQDNVGIGGAPNANAALDVNATSAILLARGTTAQRPTGVTGMLRYNTTGNNLEYYAASAWTSLSSDFTVATSQTFNGDNSTVAFTLSALSGADSYTTAGVLVMLNGVVQEPTTVYGVSGTTLTFTTAPSSGDVIEVRKFTTTTTVTSLSDADGDTLVQTEESADEDKVRIDAGGSQIAVFDSSGITLTTGSFVGTATQAQYADLAERYASDSYIDAGTVVEFVGEGKVAVCETDGTRSVAGVVSTDPAYLMNSKQEGVNLALAGRVPVKVTGSIQAGDLLVAAGNGRARAEADPKLGTVIGKAIEAHTGDEGVIEVLILMM